MREVRRADTAQPFVFDWDPVSLEPLDNLVHPCGVPGQHDVRQQGVRAGNRLHLVAAPAALRRHLARVHGALKLMHRLATVQQSVDLAAEVIDGDVVAQEHGSQQSAQMFRSPVQWIPLSGRSESLQRQRGGYTSRADRRRQAQ